MLGTIVVSSIGCKTKQTATQAIIPQPQKPAKNQPQTRPIPDFVMHGVAVKVGDPELGLIIFQGDAGPTRPGLIITCAEQLPVGTPVEVFFGNLFILDGDRPGRGQNCLHVRIARHTGPITRVPVVPFTGRMSAETVFSGNGSVVASEKNLGIIATQDNAVERVDLPAIFIDALPMIEKNDPVTCTIKHVRLTLNWLPGKPVYSGFRITVAKLPSKLTGEHITQNSAPR